MIHWHGKYFKLKEFEKQDVQEDSHVRGAFPKHGGYLSPGLRDTERNLDEQVSPVYNT